MYDFFPRLAEISYHSRNVFLKTVYLKKFLITELSDHRSCFERKLLTHHIIYPNVEQFDVPVVSDHPVVIIVTLEIISH